MAVLAGFGVVMCIFSAPVALSYARGLPAWHVGLAFAQMYIGTALWLFGGLFAAVAVYNRTPGCAFWRIVAAGVAISVVVACLLPLSIAIRNAPLRDVLVHDLRPGLLWLANVSVVAIAAAALLFVTHADDVERSLNAEALRAIELERGLDEARLQATQAQIEPHFLFNTLANIRRLYQIDAGQARTMLRQFSQMLGHSLSQIRNPRSTLVREVALAMAYVSVQKIRMGDRLEFTTDIPHSLRDADLPPMMLSTLVENAIKHGLAPLRRGGRVDVIADTDGTTLRIRVADTGRGLRENAGCGVGLANISTRLAAMFGAEGSLALEPNDHGGVTAVLALPLRIETSQEHDAGAFA